MLAKGLEGNLNYIIVKAMKQKALSESAFASKLEPPIRYAIYFTSTFTTFINTTNNQMIVLFAYLLPQKHLFDLSQSHL